MFPQNSKKTTPYSDLLFGMLMLPEEKNDPEEPKVAVVAIYACVSAICLITGFTLVFSGKAELWIFALSALLSAFLAAVPYIPNICYRMAGLIRTLLEEEKQDDMLEVVEAILEQGDRNEKKIDALLKQQNLCPECLEPLKDPDGEGEDEHHCGTGMPTILC